MHGNYITHSLTATDKQKHNLPNLMECRKSSTKREVYSGKHIKREEIF